MHRAANFGHTVAPFVPSCPSLSLSVDRQVCRYSVHTTLLGHRDPLHSALNCVVFLLLTGLE